MKKILEGKVAVLTGAGHGIGREVALLMAAQGAQVVVNDLGTSYQGYGASPAVADAVVAEILMAGGEAVASHDSIATSAGADRIIQTAVSHYGRIDTLVNLAGIYRIGLPWDMSDEDWDEVIKVHLYGYFYCSRAALRIMREAIGQNKQSSGRLINFTSHSGIIGSPGRPNYCAAKGGILALTYSTAIDLDGSGITCNAIAPHAVTLPPERIREEVSDAQILQLARKRGMPDATPADIERLRRQILGGEPDTIAPLVAWLASDEAQHVTGRIFHMIEGMVSVIAKAEEKPVVRKDSPFTIEDISQAMETLVPRQP